MRPHEQLVHHLQCRVPNLCGRKSAREGAGGAHNITRKEQGGERKEQGKAEKEDAEEDKETRRGQDSKEKDRPKPEDALSREESGHGQRYLCVRFRELRHEELAGLAHVVVAQLAVRLQVLCTATTAMERER